ncbi:putative beta-lysine N-acetyltransferase [Peribacillus muralis]|uniref:Putative beta-lysine N-acetyltransferase n=1 Tax=Peribacillus muralis TaxID=264697 RepID=A0A1B3XQ28_9BACI|nr:putative beta-lysine N-acetyltransferase [Peribacillus muralis]AOH55322.1 putative beta-lysine N-acetyltransferase [Peribacillus muralis]
METGIIERKIQKQRSTIHLTIDHFNKRVRVEDYLGHFQECLEESLKVANEMAAEKIIFKTRKENMQELLSRGFLYEGSIDKFFLGSDCFFLVKYTRNERRNSDGWAREDRILNDVLALPLKSMLDAPPSAYQVRKAELSDSKQLAQLYGKIFEVYPTPMDDPAYVKKCIENGTVFYIYLHDGKLVSAASAEIDAFYHNAEITDCATLPEHRQYGLMKHLIARIEDYLISHEIYCIYSIARSLSFGMNAALHQYGYSYRGRLANNCYIFDKLEDMNLWVKNYT